MASPHGTISRYTNGKCRCGQCRVAKKIYEAKYRTGRTVHTWVPSWTVQPHLTFLIGPGRFSQRALAKQVGMDWRSFTALYQGQTRKVLKRNADRILATSLYDVKKPATGRTIARTPT